jgi:hypothetical protein
VLSAALATNRPLNALDVLEAALATFPQTSTSSIGTSTAFQKRHHDSSTWSNTTSDVSNSTSGIDPVVPTTTAVGLPFTSEFGYGSHPFIPFTDVSAATSSEGDLTTIITVTEKTTVTEVPACTETIAPQTSDAIQPASSATTMQVDTATIPRIPTPVGNEPNEPLTATAADPVDSTATTPGLEDTAIAAGVSTSTVLTTIVFVTTTERTSTITTEQSAQPIEPTNPVVSIQTTMPTVGIQPINTPSVSRPLELTTSHISHKYHPPSLTKHHNSTASTTSTSCAESSAHQKLGTGSANGLVGTHPPPPRVPIDPTQTGIWGRPTGLTSPPSFKHHTPEAAHQKPGTGSETHHAPPVSIDQTHTHISQYHTSSKTHQHKDHPASGAITAPVVHTGHPNNKPHYSTTKHPANTQCTTTFHRTPTQACTETHYASTTTLPVNCFGCVGEHALPSKGYDENSISRVPLFHVPYTYKSLTHYPGLPKFCDRDSGCQHDEYVRVP